MTPNLELWALPMNTWPHVTPTYWRVRTCAQGVKGCVCTEGVEHGESTGQKAGVSEVLRPWV